MTIISTMDEGGMRSFLHMKLLVSQSVTNVCLCLWLC